MTDNQLKIYNRLLQFIRKLLKLIPDDKREALEEEFDTILQSNIEDWNVTYQLSRCKVLLNYQALHLFESDIYSAKNLSIPFAMPFTILYW